MNWWGKVIGGTFGFMLGGPLGAVLGAALGHNFDRGLGRIALPGPTPKEVEKIQSAFFTATFSVMGHVAKADGRVTEDEIAMARQIMQQMRLSDEQRKVAVNMFQQGKQGDFPLDDILRQFRSVTQRRRNLLQMFMEIQVATALADGSIDPAEDQVLKYVARQIGFSPRDYQKIVSRVQAQMGFHSQNSRTSQAARGISLNDAYKLLGVSKDASDAEVKKAYRRQMSQHHPDKLVAKGLPQEMMDMATQKAQDISNAYDMIKSARKM